jgi:hypothetical protein
LIQFKCCCCCFDMLEFVEGIFITSFEKIHIYRSFTELIWRKKVCQSYSENVSQCTFEQRD